MGKGYGIECTACDYSISVTEGVGMRYSPNAVFYGSCNDPSQKWSIAFPDGLCKPGKPLLDDLVENESIKSRAFALIEAGATPTKGYGHELYVCPKCNRLHNNFYFHLKSAAEEYEPDYKCSHCNSLLERAELITENGLKMVIFKNNENAHWKCPQCGNDKLEFMNGSLLRWD